MKKKLVLLILIVLLANTMPATYALQTNLPTNTISTEEEALHQKSNNLIMLFITSIIKMLKGDSTQNPVTSANVREFSTTVKSYQALEERENPDYTNSKTKDEVDFGTGILDIIAGILTFFGK